MEAAAQGAVSPLSQVLPVLGPPCLRGSLSRGAPCLRASLSRVLPVSGAHCPGCSLSQVLSVPGAPCPRVLPVSGAPCLRASLSQVLPVGVCSPSWGAPRPGCSLSGGSPCPKVLPVSGFSLSRVLPVWVCSSSQVLPVLGCSLSQASPRLKCSLSWGAPHPRCSPSQGLPVPGAPHPQVLPDRGCSLSRVLPVSGAPCPKGARCLRGTPCLGGSVSGGSLLQGAAEMAPRRGPPLWPRPSAAKPTTHGRHLDGAGLRQVTQPRPGEGYGVPRSPTLQADSPLFEPLGKTLPLFTWAQLQCWPLGGHTATSPQLSGGARRVSDFALILETLLSSRSSETHRFARINIYCSFKGWGRGAAG